MRWQSKDFASVNKLNCSRRHRSHTKVLLLKIAIARIAQLSKIFNIYYQVFTGLFISKLKSSKRHQWSLRSLLVLQHHFSAFWLWSKCGNSRIIFLVESRPVKLEWQELVIGWSHASSSMFIIIDFSYLDGLNSTWLNPDPDVVMPDTKSP